MAKKRKIRIVENAEFMAAARAIRASLRQNKAFAKCRNPIFVAPAPAAA
jgi:hypothetical protein